MAETARSSLLVFKVAVFNWIMTSVPSLRRYRAHCEARILQLADEVRDLRTERDTLIRAISQLLDERAAHRPG